MTWRDPRDPEEAVDGDCRSLAELADTYSPFVRWSDAERFFPILAESWLQHATSAPWPGKDVAGTPETGIDRRRRGTALCEANLDVTRVNVLAGTPNADDTPISLDQRLAAEDRLDARDHPWTAFLDFAGWAPQDAEGFQGREGDLDYLFRAFSELAGAVNPGRRDQWSPIELLSHLPQMWTEQPPTPTVYCEARMAEDFAALGQTNGTKDFPPGAENLVGSTLVLTYHYLFPAREPSPGEPAVRAKEGQWEAVSVFFRARRGRRPDEVTFWEPPIGVAVSQGSDGGADRPFATDFRPWADVHHEGTHAHPILFSALGSHRFFFAPTTPGETWVPGQGGPTVPTGGTFDNNSESPGWESILVIGLAIAAILAALGLWWAALIVLIIAFLLWLITLIADLCSDDSENPANPVPSNPEAQGTGAQSGDPDEPPAPGSPGGDGSPDGGASGGPGGGGFGLPNSGSATGSDTSSFDLRFIDRTARRTDEHRDGPPTGYPSSQPCEDPGWWDFTGAWGIKVTPSLGGSWASGDRRVDPAGRSLGYWHTLRYFEERLAGRI